MKWAVAQLIKKGSQIFEIDETIDFKHVVEDRDEIRRLSKIQVTGTGQLQGKKVVFQLHVEGTMTLPCALTLDDVEYPFETDTVEIFVLDKEIYVEDEDEHLVTGTTVDLTPVIWQIIMLEKPLRVVKDGAYDEMKNRGIEIESEEEFVEEQASASEEAPIDPRFAVLSKLFEDTHN